MTRLELCVPAHQEEMASALLLADGLQGLASEEEGSNVRIKAWGPEANALKSLGLRVAQILGLHTDAVQIQPADESWLPEVGRALDAPITVGPFCLISTEEPASPRSEGSGPQDAPNHLLPIHLQPGLAFGTGLHPTTQLCLVALGEQPPVDLTVLDVGAGSGVLSLAAALIGATTVEAVEIDPLGRAAVEAHAQLNGLKTRITITEVLEEAQPASVVLANIGADTLIPLAPLLARRTLPGGRVHLSGLRTHQRQALLEACIKAGLSPVGEAERSGWWRLDFLSNLEASDP